MISKHLTISLSILIVTVIVEGLNNNQTFYGTCNRSFSCGDISGFGYPFRRGQDPVYCGYPGFELNCEEQSPPTINIMNLTYHVLEIDPAGQILKIVREDMTDLACSQNPVNTTVDYNLFSYTSNYKNISLLYGCSSSYKMPIIGIISCVNNGGSPVVLVPGVQSPESCKSSIVVPFPVEFAEFMEPTELGLVLQKGFEVKWKVGSGPCNACTQSGGDCLYNNDTLLTTCACRESPLLADSCSTTRVSSPSGMQLLKCVSSWYFPVAI
uniref:LEAF RUST 10 DISEASE-RESISTANCE LOCUS RECEPTOR-LIKE PROTEIN KINASE-like 1.3 n=1 Tax=Erigeron canadensis TaxID=72917 RepID=UPI001CB8E97C|nr:LEAF RUST 10 DISEASE-RESISTANCE LOCUS RECEPTOR-LIKE PROTEIN KINASE-like 1.3 [Erigeron canadensis]